MNTQLACLIAAEVAFIIHSLIKADSLKKDFEKANIPFKFGRDYLGKDFLGITASFLTPFLWLLMFGEVAAKYPAIEGYAICTFALIGGTGSYFFQLFLSRSKKYFRAVIDAKSNIADGKSSDDVPTT